MPSQDPRVAELARLKNKLLELETQLKEERKIALRLTETFEKKSEQVNIVDAELAAEIERFRWHKEEILYQKNNFEEEHNNKLKSLKQSTKEISMEISNVDLLLIENEKLKARLKNVSKEYRNLTTKTQEEIESKRKKNFDTRMAMEEILRKMIKNVDNSYEREAIAKMQLEASQANLENEKIHKEYDIKEAKTEALIRQQQRSYDQLMRLRIELDLMTVATRLQRKNLKKMIEQNEIANAELVSDGLRVQLFEDQLQGLELALHQKVELEKKIVEVQQQKELILTDTLTYRKMTMHLASQVFAEGLQIQEKNRASMSKQIIQQLNDLSTIETEDAVDSVPPLGLDAVSTISSKDLLRTEMDLCSEITGLSSAFLPTNHNHEHIWKAPSTVQKNNQPKLSFSMMFSHM
jgi:hypothetical protein